MIDDELRQSLYQIRASIVESDPKLPKFTKININYTETNDSEQIPTTSKKAVKPLQDDKHSLIKS